MRRSFQTLDSVSGQHVTIKTPVSGSRTIQIRLEVKAKTSHGRSQDFSVGPDWERDIKIPLFHTCTFEYMIHMPVPKWDKGKHQYIAFQNSAVVTKRGAEWPYAPDQGIRIVR